MRFGEEKMVQYKEDSYFLFYLSSSLTTFHLFYRSKQVELFPFLFFFSPFPTIQMEYCWQVFACCFKSVWPRFCFWLLSQNQLLNKWNFDADLLLLFNNQKHFYICFSLWEIIKKDEQYKPEEYPRIRSSWEEVFLDSGSDKMIGDV